jgi:hypothetical protein
MRKVLFAKLENRDLGLLMLRNFIGNVLGSLLFLAIPTLDLLF